MAFLGIFLFLSQVGTAAINISNSAGWWSTCPRVTVDYRGNVHVIWVEEYGGSSGDVFYSKYDVYAKTWSSPLNLSNSGQVYSVDNRPAGIDSDPSGNIYVSYSEIINKKIKLRIFASGSWGVPLDIASFEGEGDSVRVAVDASGNIFLTWWDTAWFACYSRAYINGNWEDAKLIGGGKFPDIAVGNNVVFACWTQRNPHYQIFYAWRAKTLGASWSTPQMLAPSSLKQQVPAVEIDGNDVAHIVFTPVLTDGSRIVQYSYWTGNGFSSPQNISVATLLHYPALHERGNNIYSVWQVGGYEGGSSINYNSRISGTWQGEQAIPSSTGSTYCDVAASYYQDKIHYVWDASGDIYIHTIEGPGQAPAPKNDFNQDGQSDILWRYYGTEGANVIWYMGYSGQTLARMSEMSMDRPGGGFEITDMARGHGSDQIFWDVREAGELLNEKPIPQLYPNVQEVFGLPRAQEHRRPLLNASGREEPIESRFRDAQSLQEEKQSLVMRKPWKIVEVNMNGSPAIRVAGLTLLSWDYLPAVADPNWEIGGSGDFNGDGKTDILWRYYGIEGYNVIWYMDGNTLLGWDYLAAVADPNWKIVGTGDFNADGNVDVLWRNYGSSGENVICYMDRVTPAGYDTLPAIADPNWEIVGTGDFNTDGKVDILWRYYGFEGYNVVWYMDGKTLLNYDYLPVVADSTWRVGGVGDFNLDGKADILWRYNGSEGYNVVWYMDGATLTGWEHLPAVPGSNWKIQNR